LDTFQNSSARVQRESPVHPAEASCFPLRFINPDGKVSVVVMNKSDQKISYYLWLDGQAAEVSSLPHSIQTLVF